MQFSFARAEAPRVALNRQRPPTGERRAVRGSVSMLRTLSGFLGSGGEPRRRRTAVRAAAGINAISAREPRRRTAVRAAAGVSTLVVGAALAFAGASPAVAAASGAAHSAAHLLRPHTHGATPATVIPGPLINHGGPVQSAPRVYVDFWGWSSDPSGERPYLDRFLSSVGGTSWLATVNQYGGGSDFNLLAGTWSDPAAVPTSPSDGQIQAEAASAAAHFGTGSSVNVEIVVATPTGHSTPGFGTQWCAYHGKVASTPNITYTDLPYITDAGTNCGEG